MRYVMMRWQVALPWLILVAMMAAPAAAQTQDQARARKHFVLAQAHEKNGDYAEAAVQYVEAYKYFPSPEFFYNAGRAYELGGDAAKAVEHYERYIALDPNGRAVANARLSIEKLKPQIVAPPPEPRAPDTAPAPPETKPDTEAEPAGQTKEPAQEPTDVPSATGSTGVSEGSGASVTAVSVGATEGSGTLRIAGLSVAGVGLVAAAVGVKFALDASRLSDEIEGVDDQWTREDFAKFDEGERARTLSIAFTGIGVAALVAGGSLYLWGRSASTTEERRQTSMVPLISPDSAGFVVTRRF